MRYAGLLLPVGVAALLATARDAVQGSTAAMALVVVVVAASAFGDRLAGVLSALSAAASFDFFLVAPYYSLSIHSRDDVELALALLAVGVAVTEIASWGRRQQAAAHLREGYLHGLAELLDLPLTATVEQTSRTIGTAISQALGADRAEWAAGHPAWNDAVVTLDGRLRLGARNLSAGKASLPTDSFTALPVCAHGRLMGHFRVVSSTHVVRPSAEQLRVALLLADRMATALPSDAFTPREESR
ncbi:DUF4118 domain-containing protein [Terrabacter sp. 2RAF25]|uniref:DUF4118 domain-containing protein n=1 Tax=Terrabacter sp. 2RAF25 TaxID=3232998 RepID=UPI003F9D190D